MHHSRRARKRTAPRHGATAVEFALVAPVFFLFMIASFEFSRLNVIRHTADNAAYEAARIAMVPGATAAEAVAEANRLMNIAGARGTTVSVNPPTLGPNITDITVTVDVPMGQNGWITPRFTGASTLRGISTLKAERSQ